MRHINRNISIIERCNLQYRNNAFRHLGLKGYQYSYMTRICRNPGISQEQLTKEIHIDKSNVTRSLAKLEAIGYITRENDPKDHRFLLIYPTPAGEAIFPEILSILSVQRDAMMEGFSTQEQDLLNSLLTRLRKKAEILVEMEVTDEENTGLLDSL